MNDIGEPPNQLNGFRPSHRNRWYLVSSGAISKQAFLLLEYILDVFDFDERHKKFGLYEYIPEELESVFKCKRKTIATWHKELISTGFSLQHDKRRSLYQINHPKRYIAKKFWSGEAEDYVSEEKDKNSEKIYQNLGIKITKEPQTIQKIGEIKDVVLKDNEPRTLGIPSRVESRVASKKIVKQKVRSEEEYQKIYESGPYQRLTPDDMKWIDENITEVKEATDEVTEKDYVDIFFNGNWDEYRKHVVYDN